MHGPWPNPRQSEEGWQQLNLVPRKVRTFFGLINKDIKLALMHFFCGGGSSLLYNVYAVLIHSWCLWELKVNLMSASLCQAQPQFQLQLG